MKTIGVLLITVALVAGVVGCQADSDKEPTPTVEYSLTISSSSGGKVTTPGEGVFTYEEGGVVSLVASPDSGYRFTDWTGDVGTVADITAASTAITMSGDYSITASFLKQYSLTISSTTGGSVTIPGEGTFAFDEGDVVHLMAEPEDGYQFVGWAGGGAPIADVTTAYTTITMSGNHVIVAGFATARYFQVDVYAALSGPASLPPEERDPQIHLNIMTNIIMDSVRVDMPDGGSITVPAYSGVFTPGVDWIDLFRFATAVPGLPIAGEEYLFTALNAAGEPMPGVTGTDIWVGVEPPEPPTDLRADVVEDGVLMSWHEVPIVHGSFEPGGEPPIGSYHIWVPRIDKGEGESTYGASPLSSPHLLPYDRASFVEGQDWGLALNEMEDGTYAICIGLHSFAPEGSLGRGVEYLIADHDQVVVFTITDGKVMIG